MIKVKNLKNDFETIVNVTIFPDKSSQVWKLPVELFADKPTFKITWFFESEAEVMHLLQLSILLHNNGEVVDLFIPFFPYARQDKVISNETTFAQSTIVNLLEIYFDCGITVFDLHNPTICSTSHIENIEPTKFIVKSLIASQADLICYPDAGAAKRYDNLINFVVAEKTRDQLTGKILGHQLLESKHSLEGKVVLVVDDLCDGGATFKSVAKMLFEAGAATVDLYVSHGVFSQGIPVIKAAGIRNIYTTNSYIGSSDMSKSLVTIYNVEE